MTPNALVPTLEPSAGPRPTRREVLSGLGLAAASLASGQAEAQPAPAPSPAPAFRAAHVPKPLPFDPAKLNGISEKLIRSHWENNYSGAVKALNAVEERLTTAMKDKDLPPYLYGDWKREELVRTGSVVLHENYFANLGGDGKPSGAALALIKEWFLTYEAWEAEFRRVGLSLSGGSGCQVRGRLLS
jgi:Fe-Mn family superoxide dismutase